MVHVPGYAKLIAPKSHRGHAIFSIHGNERSHKYGLIDVVHKTFHGLRRGPLELQDALVVLASRQYASWLQDNEFMAALVNPFHGRRPKKKKDMPHPEFNVLAAAVDGLHPLHGMGDTPHGFSFFYGPMKRMMPNLWQDDGQPKPLREPKLQAAIKFQFGRRRTLDKLDCTLPLANTIFQNGLQSTLLASRWRRPSNRAMPELLQIKEKQSQEVAYWLPKSASDISVDSPIVPITVPREIVAGLGNIVSQISVQGQTMPASAELETAVNELYARRTKEGHEFPPGPVGVWAIVVPDGPFQKANLELLREWTGDLNRIQTAYDEWFEALAFKDLVHQLLRNGSRVYRILSGGGGWGKKQGLLSLDPETTYSSSSEEKDLESFIRSFESQHDGGDQQGVVSPGSWIQYFVSPPMSARPNPPRPRGATMEIALGASESATSEEPPRTDGPPEWKAIPEHFGAVSNHGLFVKCETSGLVSESKLDVPGSWVGCLKLGNP
ncbi:uncharacterized protein LY79DRAFT_503681 [Colletotrichum navitas]|uniref:V-type c subunit family protein n=1 Tax=Colletotrichum navitas TaxID=681940 RepID=A0AAD8QDU7_9PEZI|nr:uncharacterized protein LY79DRAFT_503681 [Colletotrichum navitas]KAK1600414.1 hypothetical protein LY79DRAFT_503681 [Colletotrichum navitas]